MSDSTPKIDKIAAKGHGFTVPEGYFQDFATKMAASLPFREELDTPQQEAAQKQPRNSRWMRVRPYVYMAAMFAGTWCLLKMFSLMTADRNDINIDHYPALAQGLQDKEFVETYIIDDIEPYEIIEDYYAEGLIDVPSVHTAAELTSVQPDENTEYTIPTAPEGQETTHNTPTNPLNHDTDI